MVLKNHLNKYEQIGELFFDYRFYHIDPSDKNLYIRKKSSKNNMSNSRTIRKANTTNYSTEFPHRYQL